MATTNMLPALMRPRCQTRHRACEAHKVRLCFNLYEAVAQEGVSWGDGCVGFGAANCARAVPVSSPCHPAVPTVMIDLATVKAVSAA